MFVHRLSSDRIPVHHIICRSSFGHRVTVLRRLSPPHRTAPCPLGVPVHPSSVGYGLVASESIVGWCGRCHLEALGRHGPGQDAT